MNFILALLGLSAAVGAASAASITVRNPQKGTELTLDVELTDKVWTLKDLIHDKLPSAPVDDQILMHDNSILYNLLPLANYNLKDGDSILLEVLHDERRPVQPKPVQMINVNWNEKETQFIVPVNLTDTVLSVKEKIHQNWPLIAVDKEVLVIDELILTNDRTLKSYGLKDGSNISLNVSHYVDPLVGPKSSKKLFIRWTRKGLYFPVDVELTDTVWTLKDRIHDMFPSAPVEDQSILHVNDFLNDIRTLDSYQLRDGDSISLGVYHDESRPQYRKPVAGIFVDWPRTGIHFEVLSNLTDTVRSIKEQIHNKWPLIGVHQQSLVFDNHQLVDDRTLKSYGIRDQRRVILDVLGYKDPLTGPKSSKKLFIRWTQKGIYFPMDVELTDTVWTLKDKIHDMFPSAPINDQLLVHVNDFLHNLRNLDSYGLKNGDSILLEVLHDERRPVQPTPVQIISVGWDQADVDFFLSVNLTDTVGSLKEKIHQKWPSILVNKQVLVYNNNVLSDDRILKSYGLRDKRGVSLRVLNYSSHQVGPKSSKKLIIKWAQKMIHFAVDVELTDTVWSLKDRIHDLVPSIPVDDQILIHANDFLWNLKTLDSYGLRDGDSLLLEVHHDQNRPVQPKPVQMINVQWDQSETRFVVPVNLSDTVRSVKEKVHQKWPSIAIDKEVLMYDKLILNNDRTLKSYGLRADSNVVLNVLEYHNHPDDHNEPESSDKLTIKWAQRQVYFPVKVNLTDTVKELKEKIHKVQPLISVDRQELLHENSWLNDSKTLESYGLQDGDSILLEVASVKS